MKLGLLVLGGAAMAQEGPEPGCYARSYSQAHLAAHPDQVVRALWLMVQDQDLGGGPERLAYLVVDFAAQGHVAAAGLGAQRLDQSLLCFKGSDGRRGCAVDCDGGSFVVARAGGGSLSIVTDYLMVGATEECGGALDLAEVPGQAVTYRLDRVGMDQCLAQVRD